MTCSIYFVLAFHSKDVRFSQRFTKIAVHRQCAEVIVDDVD